VISNSRFSYFEGQSHVYLAMLASWYQPDPIALGKLLITLAFPGQAITLDGFRQRQGPASADFQGTSKT